MTGEYATITLHLFPGGMLAECEDTDESIVIPEGKAEPLIDFIDGVAAVTDPNATFAITDKGREEMKKMEEKQ